MVLNFHMQHDKAAGLQNDKIQDGWESEMAVVAKNRKKKTTTPEPLDIFR